jgi:hypothetical protein
VSTDRNKTAAAWRRGIDYYEELAAKRADEGSGVQLACLVLADYCVYAWSGDRGGPKLEMVQLAEDIIGSRLNEVIAGFMTEAA